MPVPEFHIHIDAQKITPEFERMVTKCYGFLNDDFVNLEGASGYEPLHHLTLKLMEGEKFIKFSEQLLAYLRQNPLVMIGYIECESLPRVKHLKWHKFDKTVPIPFRIELTQLAQGTFRESEIHVHIDWTKSDKRLIANLREIGLLTAYKADHQTAIYTVQGLRQQINELWPLLVAYIKQTGGAEDCWIFEERIPENRWWMSSPDYRLPPVVARIIKT